MEDKSFKIFYSTEDGAKHDFQVKQSGFKSTNPEGNRVVIGAIDKLVVSFLSPYTPWPELKKTAEDIYKVFRICPPNRNNSAWYEIYKQD